uniref:WAP domain-containing protein n=1 Tax=Gopherus agassizii TaxID=38772 RepID=A0A452H8U5_9SAUR
GGSCSVVSVLECFALLRLLKAHSTPLTAKPGTCPLIASTCRMINPPDKCKEDRDCFGPKKCCISVCGKECLPPNQGTTLGQYF